MGADRNNHSGDNQLSLRAHELVAEWAVALKAGEASDPAGAELAVSPASTRAESAPAAMLDEIRHDTDGFTFLRSLLDAVMGAGDPFAAALGLRDAAAHMPESLPLRDRFAVRAGGIASLGLPWAVLPIARKWLRERVTGMVWSQRFPANPGDRVSAAGLSEYLAQRVGGGADTVLRLTGAEVLGPEGITAEVNRAVWLLQQSGVRQVSVDPQRLVSGPTPWSDDTDAEVAAQVLRPLLEQATASGARVTLHPRSLHGAVLAPEILFRACADPVFNGLEIGLVLPAELPESAALADRLIRWSRARVREGGSPLSLVITNTGMAGAEQILSVLTGLPVPTLQTRAAQDAQAIRLLSLLAGAAEKGDVRVVCATEDPQLLATACALLEQVPTEFWAVQLRAGTADTFAAALRAPHLQYDLPVSPSEDHTALLATVIALAAEACEAQTPLARVAEFTDAARAGTTGAEQGDRIAGLVAVLDDPQFPTTHRTQRREREGDPTTRDSALFYRSGGDTETFDTGGLTAAVLGLTRGSAGEVVREQVGDTLAIPAVTRSGFANEPITDALTTENRDWLRRRLRAAHTERQAWQHDENAVENATGEGSAPNRERAFQDLLASAASWQELRPVDRSVSVRRLALGVATARDRFFTVCAAETGAPVSVLDTEINGAIDVARALAPQAAGLGAVRGAVFIPDAIVLVVCEAGIPLDERAEALLAALAVGSAVVCVVHPSVARSTALLREEWEAAGLPTGLLHLSEMPAHEFATETPALQLSEAQRWAADPRITRAIVLGSRSTATHLLRMRPDLRIEGRFRVLGSAAITPSADPSVAVRAVVHSAFGASHRSAHLTRAVVLLGGSSRTTEILRLLADAVHAQRPGDTAAETQHSDPNTGVVADPLALTISPLSEPPTAAGLRALTELAPGERWLVRPEALDPEWRLWSPGVRVGVKADATFWNDAIGVPVIGVTSARTVSELTSLQSLLGGGSVAALHAREASEVIPWLEGVYAARAVVGHSTTPALTERNPSGGWGDAGMGTELLVGGPHRLLGLGSWQLREGTQSQTLHLRGLSPEVQLLIETAQPELDYATFDRVRRAALSDALAWRGDLGKHTDPVGLGVRQHVIRRRPVRSHVRHSEGAALGDLVRVLAAALLVNAPLSVSTGEVLPTQISELLYNIGIPVSLEHDEQWRERVAVHGPDGFAGETETRPRGRVARALTGRIPVSRAVVPDTDATARIRLIGGDPVRTSEWFMSRNTSSLWFGPVTMAGPLELLAFLREQAVSVNAHEHGMIAQHPEVHAWFNELDERVVLRHE